MTKKHYIAIAAIINRAHARYTDHTGINYITEELMTVFKNDNPNFNHERFYAACTEDNPK